MRLGTLAFTATVLAGCYAPTGSFRPLSRGMMNQPRMVKEAIEIYDGDLKELRDGGALFIGTLTIELSGAEPAKDAAYYGATHFLLRGTDTQKVGVGVGWAAHVESSTDALYWLYRVPRSKWRDLPEKLQPHQ